MIFLGETRFPENVRFIEDQTGSFDLSAIAFCAFAIFVALGLFYALWFQRKHFSKENIRKLWKVAAPFFTSALVFCCLSIPVAYLFPNAAWRVINLLVVIFLLVVPALSAIVVYRRFKRN